MDKAERRKHYACMPHERLTAGEYVIVAVQPEHVEAIRQWRNSQIAMLRQSAPISPQEQVRYFDTVVWPEMEKPEPALLLVAFLRNDTLVGYGGLVHLAWVHRRGEVSFLLDPALAADPDSYRAGHGAFLSLIKILAFDDLGLHRLYAETYAFRSAHMATMEEHGFQREGIWREHVWQDGKPVDSVLHGCLRTYER